MLKKCIYIKKLLFLSVLSIELLLLLLSITFFVGLFLNVRMTWTQLHYLRTLTYLDFLAIFFFPDQKTKQNVQVLSFSASLSLAVMHRSSMPVSVFQLAFDVTRKLNPTYPEVLAARTEPRNRTKRPVSKATPQTTHLFISLVHSFVALPLICFFVCLFKLFLFPLAFLVSW